VVKKKDPLVDKTDTHCLKVNVGKNWGNRNQWGSYTASWEAKRKIGEEEMTRKKRGG